MSRAVGLPQLQRAHAGDLAPDTAAVRDQRPHDVDSVLVGDRDQIVHLARAGLGPGGEAHGVAADQAGIDFAVGAADELRTLLDRGDGVALVAEPLRQIEADTAEAEDQDVFVLFHTR